MILCSSSSSSSSASSSTTTAALPQPTTSYHCRNARESDALEMSNFLSKTFEETFASVTGPADMAEHCEASYREEIQLKEIQDPRVAFLLCCESEDGKIIGASQVVSGSTTSCIEAQRPTEIRRFYVDKPWHGTGVAHELMNQTIALVSSQAADKLWLGVYEKNARALKFYSKYGFEEVGEHIFQVGSDPQRDVIVVKSM